MIIFTPHYTLGKFFLAFFFCIKSTVIIIPIGINKAGNPRSKATARIIPTIKDKIDIIRLVRYLFSEVEEKHLIKAIKVNVNNKVATRNIASKICPNPLRA